jgi:peptide/nickel transport system permease protein
VIKYLVKRLLLLLVTLFGITLITFVMTRLTPGDPAAAKVAPGGGGMRAQGGYQEMVERNRRNLGLDKPMLVNFRFEDRDFGARMALYDYIRSVDAWKDYGQRQLLRISTIALPHAIELHEQVRAGNFPTVEDSQGRQYTFVKQEEALARIEAILPSLAPTAGISSDVTGTARADAYKAWWKEREATFRPSNVRAIVQAYLKGSRPIEDVRPLGGFAIPELARGLDEPETQERADAALALLTSIRYRTSEETWEQQRERVVSRWNSWWLRERGGFEVVGPVSQAFSIVTNTQFGLWVRSLLRLDFGDSYKWNRPVLSLVKERLPASLQISILSILAGYLLAIPIGIFSAMKKNTMADRTVTVILFVLYSLPTFWVATMLILSATGEGYFPRNFPTRGFNSEGITRETAGALEFWMDRLWHLVLPVTVLTYGSLAFVSRQMRAAMLEVVKLDYVRTARAKGLSETVVVLKHALRNSLIPIITISAGVLPELIAGSVVVEFIFTIPGMGLLTFDAILNRDYPVINAVLFFSAFLTLLGILLADLAYAVADPRISYE